MTTNLRPSVIVLAIRRITFAWVVGALLLPLPSPGIQGMEGVPNAVFVADDSPRPLLLERTALQSTSRAHLIVTVFNDLNGDGVQSNDEPGIEGVRIEIRKAATSELVTSVLTHSTGVVLVPGLEVGDYEIRQLPTPGFYTPKPRQTTVVEPLLGASVRFASQKRGTIAGVVFDDDNQNGVRDPGEPGISGVQVALIASVSPNRQTATTADGLFAFADLDPLAFEVRVFPPVGVTPISPTQVAVSVPVGGTATADFALYLPKARPPRISLEPPDLAAIEGRPASLAAEIDGTEPILVQWFRNGVPLTDGTNRTLTLTVVRPEDAGRYQLEARNVAGSAQSREAILSVLPADPYVRWAAGQDFAPEFSGKAADPDGDRLSNLLEFLLGTSPVDPASKAATTLVVVPRGAAVAIGFEFPWSRQAAELYPYLQATEDFVRWRTIPSITEEVRADGSTRWVRLLDPSPLSGQPRRFLRLAVSSEPPPPPPPQLRLNRPATAGAGYALDLTGQSGRTYVIESSPDLVSWTPLREVVAQGGQVTIPDDTPASSPARFYRAVLR